LLSLYRPLIHFFENDYFQYLVNKVLKRDEQNPSLKNFYLPKDLTGALLPEEEGVDEGVLTAGEVFTCGELLNVRSGRWL
jgi:hypothetical protein